MTKSIPLTRGKFALVDDEDFDGLNQLKWQCHAKGYAVCHNGPRLTRKMTWMHRVIMKTPDGMSTDHINGDKLDNRRSNLRICTAAENQHNQKARQGTFKGVYWKARNKKWEAAIRVGGKRKYLGLFPTAEDAATAYDAAAHKYFGVFAKGNFE